MPAALADHEGALRSKYNGPMVETCYSEREQTSKDESQAVSCSSLHLEKTVPVVCA